MLVTEISSLFPSCMRGQLDRMILLCAVLPISKCFFLCVIHGPTQDPIGQTGGAMVYLLYLIVTGCKFELNYRCARVVVGIFCASNWLNIFLEMTCALQVICPHAARQRSFPMCVSTSGDSFTLLSCWIAIIRPYFMCLIYWHLDWLSNFCGPIGTIWPNFVELFTQVNYLPYISVFCQNKNGSLMANRPFHCI